MLYTLASLLMPPLLVFGLYHLLTWFNVLGINRRAFWKRVAAASAVSYFLLASGFFVFAYVDYRQDRPLAAPGSGFELFLYNRSAFWRLMAVFDTLAMVVLLAIFSLLDRFTVDLPGLLIVTILVTYIIGLLQWYFVGGGIGAVLERFWSGLKTGDEDDEDWF